MASAIPCRTSHHAPKRTVLRQSAGIGRGGGEYFQLCDALFQCVEFLARALQDLRLNVEFLTANQIEPGKKAGQQSADILFDIGGRTGGDQSAQAPADLLENFGVKHGEAPEKRGESLTQRTSAHALQQLSSKLNSHQTSFDTLLRILHIKGTHCIGAQLVFHAPALCANTDEELETEHNPMKIGLFFIGTFDA
jgi:hypothetical protein